MVDYVSSPGLQVIKEGLALARAEQSVVVASGLGEPVRLALELGGVLPDLVVEENLASAIAHAGRLTST